MCGICGLFNPAIRALVDGEFLARMDAKLRRRGPDDGGPYLRGNLGMAMCRLAIIDVAGGQ
jgi:asparagine synthetase B (glutamine-hydrolysing)